jgi:hypothetical protein
MEGELGFEIVLERAAPAQFQKEAAHLGFPCQHALYCQ